MYFIVFIAYVFHCFYDFFFCNLILINFKINCANSPKDRINTVLVHSKKIYNFHVFCTQTYAKCGFWANFVPTREYRTSRDLATDGLIFANLISKDA